MKLSAYSRAFWWSFNLLWFIFFYQVSSFEIGLTANVSDSWLNFEMPMNNWRSYGPSLLLSPFTKLPNGLVIALFIFWFIGMYYYEKITLLLLSGRWLQIALWSLPINTYLFWSFKSQQEFVLEWAFLMGAIYYFLRKKIGYFLAFISLTCFIRPGNIALAIFLIAVLKMSLLKKLVFPGVLLVWLTVNFFNYGNFSPALQSGETLSFGWNKGYLITLPLADIDAAYSKNRVLGDPEISARTTDVERNRIFTENAVEFVKDNPAEVLAIAASKIDSWFFSILRVPNLNNQFSTSADGRRIVMESTAFSMMNTLGSLVFALWRAFSLITWFVALFLLIYRTITMRKSLLRSDLLLFIPVVGFPAALLTTPETRYQLAQLVVLVPISLHYLSKRVNLRLMNEI